MARLLQEGTFPVRKEAAFGVANMCRSEASWPFCCRSCLSSRLDLGRQCILCATCEAKCIRGAGPTVRIIQQMLCLKSADDQSLMAAMVGTSMEDVPARVLPAFASLARSPDPEASLLAIHFFEAVLRLLPQQGQQMVESVDGIDILEQQQMRQLVAWTSGCQCALVCVHFSGKVLTVWVQGYPRESSAGHRAARHLFWRGVWTVRRGAI